jgi:two-component system, NtrC family, response regulator AtoC
MPTELQVKLLRVVETGTFLRIGGDREVATDVRVVAATNRSPEEAAAEGKLRPDLLYRLTAFPIYLPPLRDRVADIELLAHHFLEILNAAKGSNKRFASAALERLRTYTWPGNVRELKNVVQRAFILSDDHIDPECLPQEVQGLAALAGPYLHIRVGTPLAEVEQRLICPSSTGTACSYSRRLTVHSQRQPGACAVVTPMAMHNAQGSACRHIK